jgi:hypothetical protein
MFTEMYVKKFTISGKFKVVSKLVWIMQEVSENLNFHADLSLMTCAKKIKQPSKKVLYFSQYL